MAVRIIPAQPRVEGTSALQQEGALRVAAYARVSTELEEQESSYEAQCTHYENYITNHEGWTLAGIYADEGLSATSTKKREQFNKMIADCEAGLVDMVITKSISRFARNTLDCLQNVRKLKALGIPVIFEKENIDSMGASGELFLTIMASLAQQESASISQNTRMGWQYNFQQGKPMLVQSRFLGYTKKRGDMKLTIVPEEADIVRSIFRMYLEGYSAGDIILTLEEKKIPTPGGKEHWLHSTINSMLQNEKFMGDLLLQKSYVADFLTKRREKNDGVFPQYYVENAHDPVVPKEVFYRVQGEFERRREGSTINDRKYALSGKIYCADCDEKYSRCAGTEKYPDAVWRCRKKRCGKTVKEDDLKKAVITAFNRTPECREELIRMQERLQWGQMDRISEEIAAVDMRKIELENAISDYASTGTLDSRMIFLYGDGTEDVEAAIEGIRVEMENLACMKMDLLTQKGELAMREAQIHSLLRLTEAIEKRETPSSQEEEAARPDPSCTTLEDFYQRTDDIDVKGRIRKYDKRLVRRFIERVEVKPESLVICFKAGVSVEVAG